MSVRMTRRKNEVLEKGELMMYTPRERERERELHNDYLVLVFCPFASSEQSHRFRYEPSVYRQILSLFNLQKNAGNYFNQELSGRNIAKLFAAFPDKKVHLEIFCAHTPAALFRAHFFHPAMNSEFS